ncbi:MAG: hypothetical protein JXB33_10425, partial [Clostridia bacterium]|nr:hypothetical protein [Clostridia bacterium]
MAKWEKYEQERDKAAAAVASGRGLYDEYGIHPGSVHCTDECRCFMADENDGTVLVVEGGSAIEGFEGRTTMCGDKTVRVCPLSNKNSGRIREIFAFTNPVSAAGRNVSIGLGDRLG